METAPPLDGLKDFISRYRNFSDKWADKRLADFRTAFAHIRVGMDSIAELAADIDRYKAEDYNIFRVLGVATKEVSTHSAFLANIFDPNESHGQGLIFLQQLLNYSKLKDTLDIDITKTTMEEFKTETEKLTIFGRLDIVLSCYEKGILVVIENKVYAGEQENQLIRYWKWMETQKRYYPSQALIYLTPSGKESQTANFGIKYICMSYRKDILKMLKNSLIEVQSQKVAYTIRQYLQLIQTF